MPDHVLLLRAINLVRRNRVAMGDLRALLEQDIGGTDVVTVLASGNALFRSPRRDRATLARDVETALVERLGLDVTAFVLGPEDLDRVVRDNPLPEAVLLPKQLLVAFLDRDPDPAQVAAVDHASFAPERVVFGPRVIYLWYANGLLDTRIAPGTWERLGVRVTARTWGTVLRLDALAKERAARHQARRRRP